MNLNLRALIGKLNHETRAAVEAAAGLCLSRTHYDVEIEHFLMKALDTSDGDVALILKHYGVDRSRLAAELTRSLDKLKSGNARSPSLSPSLVRMLGEAWSLGSVNYGAARIRTGHTLVALTSDEELARLVRDVSKELQKLPAEALRTDFAAIVASSVEEEGQAATEPGGGRAGASGRQDTQSRAVHRQPHRAGQAGQASTRCWAATSRSVRWWTSSPGGGRTIRFSSGRLASARRRWWRDSRVRIANGRRAAAAQERHAPHARPGAAAGGRRREGRVREPPEGPDRRGQALSPTPIILFIDEAHTMIGAGGAGRPERRRQPAQAGPGPRRAAHDRGHDLVGVQEVLREGSGAGAPLPAGQGRGADRRSRACSMLRGVVAGAREASQVRILDDGLDAAVRLSHRYLADRQLPDKAVSVLDTACARLALGQNATPPAIEDAQRPLDDLEVQRGCWSARAAVGADHTERLGRIATARSETEARLAGADRALGPGARAGRHESARSGASSKARLQPRRPLRRATAAPPARQRSRRRSARGARRHSTSELEALQGEIAAGAGLRGRAASSAK